MKKVGLHTLGCKLNFSESSTIARQFGEKGFARVEFEEEADVYVINTCSVTDNADKKCRKAVREALRRNPEAFVVVMGCYAQLKPQEIASIPGVDLVLGAKEKFRLFDLVSDFTKGHACKIEAGKISALKDFSDAFSLGDRTRSFLKIQDGCDYKCTFCTIPLARGSSRSDSLDNILRNAEKIAQAGVKEIVLTGVNIGDFGKGSQEKFIDVVKALDKVQGIERIRISSIEPNLLTDEIIRFVATADKFMPHFHVPLQSGNDEILSTMRRRYKRELYASRVEAIKSAMPHACIGVDVIVGFPGETEAQFRDSAQFISGLDVSYLHVFTYSERLNTLAPTLGVAVPAEVRMERNEILRNLSDRKKEAFATQFSGQIRPVLFESGKKQENLEGFTDNYIPVRYTYVPEMVNTIREMKLLSWNPGGWMELEQVPETLIVRS